MCEQFYREIKLKGSKLKLNIKKTKSVEKVEQSKTYSIEQLSVLHKVKMSAEKAWTLGHFKTESLQKET